MDITGPTLDFVHLAGGMGVEAVRVEKADDIVGAIAKAVAADRPTPPSARRWGVGNQHPDSFNGC